MNKNVTASALLGLALALSACAAETPEPAASGTTTEASTETAGPAPQPQSTVPPPVYAEAFDLPAVFDCVRESGGMLVAAHRGGPAIGYAENSLETLQHAFAEGIPVMEIDVAETRDGVLFLMHDRTLGRTSTGQGAVADTDFKDIAMLNLKDINGDVTSQHPPKFTDVLLWANQYGAILEIDRKETTSFRNLIAAIRAAHAENNVIMITYNDDEAKQVAKLAPELMMTAGIGGKDHEAEMIAGGIDPTRLIVWGGTEKPSYGKWKALNRKGIESAFGTLGRPETSLDGQFWADGDASEYDDLAAEGLTMVATDEPYRVTAAISADDKAKGCLN